MSSQAYIVATLARGTASLGFSYSGRPELEPGTLVAISLRGKLETGVVLGIDPDPPESAKLLPLLELQHPWRRCGELILRLAQLSASGAHEVIGHMLFDGVAASLRLELAIGQPGLLTEDEKSAIGRLSGKLGTGRARTLLRENGWKRICELAAQGGIRLELKIAGTPGVTRMDARLRRWYDSSELALEYAPADNYMPGNYLHGFHEHFNPRDWLHREQKHDRWQYESAGQPQVQEQDWPEGWRILQDVPKLADTRLTRCRTDIARLAELLLSSGLDSISSGKNCLVILPQLWMQQRLWPELLPLAPRLHWYGSDSTISAASFILGRLDEGGQIVMGGPSAWKLSAWGRFDRVLLVDPSHPQYAADREPHLDYREALLACLSGTAAELNLVEMGLSVLDGSSGLESIRIELPRTTVEAAERHDGSLDTDPLPLHLRQPGISRLVHFNRLGSSRGLRCVDCGSLVDCPECGSRRIHFSQAKKGYTCPDCSFSSTRLRCQKCGLATLSSQLPGLEAVQRREGDVIIHGGAELPQSVGEGSCVIGTSQLLQALPGFRPQQLVHVHADNPVGYLENWPQEIDMLARLAALYPADEDQGCWIVSERLPELLGNELDAAGITQRYKQEMGLRKLATLPPFGLVYRFRLFTRDFQTAERLRQQLGDRLKGLPDTTVLRLGRPVAISGSVRLSGYFVNDELSYSGLQELRWELFAGHGTLSIQPVRGPWL